MARFTFVTLGICALLAAAMTLGGIWPLVAFLYMTVFAFFMDKIAALTQADHPGQEFPTGNALSVILGLLHFPLLYGGIARLFSESTLGSIDKILLFISLSLFLGQVSNSNAHELIHRAQRPMRRLGVAVYSAILFGHHASAHVRVHHVHAATDRDPNSARLGESYYVYARRAWIGALREGFRAETRLRKGKGAHPYLWYMIGALASLGLAYAIGRIPGVLWLLALSAYAQAQLLLSDYVQHYGLRRHQNHGRTEPVGPQHSWNAPQGFTSALMLNAPRHSDHHAHPARPYPGLDLDRQSMPILPYSLPMMAVIALVPPLWRRIMDKRARKWAGRRPV